MAAPGREIDAAAIRRGKIRRRKIFGVMAVVVVIAVIGFAVVGKAKKKDNSINLVTAQVERATISQKISATGSVTAQTGAEVKIGSQITGRIKNLYADVGSHVVAGQVIAELDLPDMRAQLEQAKANLSSARIKAQQEASGVGLQRTGTSSDIIKAKAGLASAKASYNQAVQNAKLEVNTSESSVKQAQASSRNAQSSLKRLQQLLDKGYISAQDVDNAQTQADVAAAQLDSAQQNLALTRAKTATDLETAHNAIDNAQAILSAANAGTAQNTIKMQSVAVAKAAVRQAEAQVAYQEAQYAKTVIRTPVSGTVVTMDAQQGETIAAGLSAPTLVQVVDLNRLQVDAYVDETDIGNVHAGQVANVTVDAYPDIKFRGRVVRVASAATMQQNVVTYDTTVALENPRGLLKPDMTATVEVEVSKHENVIAVPVDAVKADKTGQIVYVIQGKGIDPKPVSVRVGISDDRMTEILSGLSGNETVVLAGYPPSTGIMGPGGARMPLGPMGGGGRGGGRGGGGGGH